MALVTKLPGEPIVVVNLSFPLHQNDGDVRDAQRQIAALAAAHDEPLYCLLDLSAVPDICLSDILLWLEDQKNGPPGSISDPRLRQVVIGADMMAALWHKKLRQCSSRDALHYPTLERALRAIRSTLYSPSLQGT